jgi:hypothetical protein
MAAVAAAGLVASVASAAGKKSATMPVRASVLQPASVSVSVDLSTGAVKTKGSNPTGTVIVPASFPSLSSPSPSYPDTSPVNGAKATPPNAARVDVAGSPNATFTLNFQRWTQMAGTAGATASGANNTYYSPSNSPTNQPRGVFDAQGRASVYVGSSVVLARDPSGTTVTMKPSVSISYN